MFINPFTSTTCPCCSDMFHLTEAPIRMTHGELEPDRHLGAFLSIDPAPALTRVRVPRPAANFLQRFHLENLTNGQRVCPKCHIPLPLAMANSQLPGEIISFIGVRGSGKSNYLAVLLKFLRERYANQVGFTIFDQQTFSMQAMTMVGSDELFHKRYGGLFNGTGDPTAIGQTPSFRTNADGRVPLIYRLEINAESHPYFGNPAANLVLFDAPGEDLVDPAALDRFYPYIPASTGIVFVIDPMQLDCIRERLPQSLLGRFPKLEAEPRHIIARVIEMFEKKQNLRPGEKITIPAAFVFTKCDVFQNLEEIEGFPSMRLTDSMHRGGFDRNDCVSLSTELSKRLENEWGGSGLLALARAKFKHAEFFAVSALGATPNERSTLRHVSPMRVGDPFLWLLHKRGYIRSIS